MSDKRTIMGETGKMAEGIEAAKYVEAGIGSLNWFNRAWMEWAGAIGTEFTQFVADRIREDFRTQHAMLNCREPAKLQEIQKEFLDKAVADYSAETGRLVEIGNAFVDRFKRPDQAS